MTTISSYNVTNENLDEDVQIRVGFTEKSDFIQALYFVFAALGIPGNILTLVVLLSCPCLRVKPINLFIIHQSFIDIFACVFTLLEEYVIDYKLNGPFLCHVFLSKYTSVSTMYTSSYNMTALTLERHFAIIDPLHYDSETVRKRLPYIFVFVWLFCFIALGYVPISTVYMDPICFITMKIKPTPFWDWMSPYICFIAIGIPLSVMSICYIRMFYALYKSSRSLGVNSANGKTDKLRLAQMNIFQTCLIMILIFLVCWMTLESALVLFIFEYYNTLSGTHYSVGTLLTIVNSGINPYIYVFRYDDFKKQLRKLFNVKQRETIATSTTELNHNIMPSNHKI